ncbi:19477_t:CDS:1 [Cetraspora pellucida]|uniref:19477_t:CDS:1 n=1 Tax=Cetraspora pellucida TaxID=1433469 RepID=A0A9N9NM87_9GLOM|nr:19477_t:CDS:1 [Cetraspora pellucida]
MACKIFSRLFSLLLILLITITILDAADPTTTQSVKNQSSKNVVPPTRSSTSQIRSTSSTVFQSLPPSPTPTQQYNHDFNSLPGNPDPEQIKIITATTIKHYGTNKSAKPTGIAITHAENGAANKRTNFGVVLGMAFVGIIVLLF